MQVPVLSARGIWGGSKGVINFLWIFYAVQSLVWWAFLEYIQALIHLPCLWVFSVTLWVIVYRLYRARWQEQNISFKWSHWILSGWWTTGSPKLQLFQLSQHSHITNCQLISSSDYFPWNMTLKYKMQLPEGSWDKILHFKSRMQSFSKEKILFFWRFVSRSDTPKSRK